MMTKPCLGESYSTGERVGGKQLMSALKECHCGENLDAQSVGLSGEEDQA